ncbi:MAG: hypothetical protein QHJ82_05240 [Verrucomicrobiota bacterium]|nr:hypothetical protein [Verrucomicrobiota bacterium]
MADMIHVTLQYSDAVLTALLPIFSDFAKKLELPVPVPITVGHVQHFNTRGPVIPGYPIDVRGYLVLTNGWRFWYALGHVDSFESPENFYTLQDLDRVPEYVGTLKMSKREAVKLARDTLKKMDYAEKLPQTSKQPKKVAGPLKWRGETLPYYEVEWKWKTGDKERVIRFNIDGQERKVTKFFSATTNLWSEAPRVDVVPELESEYRKRVMEGKQIHRRDPPPARLPPP